MSDFDGLTADLTALLRQTLTVDLLTPGQPDPQTGASGGPGTTVNVLTQPCSLQPVRFRQRGGGAIVDGVAGSQPSFICYTAYFAPPAGGTVEVRVDGVLYPLLKQGVGQDVAGQHGMLQLELGAAEPSR